MKNQTQPLKSGQAFSDVELMRALYDIQDILERALCPYLLLGDTARSLIEKGYLAGDGIYIGIEKKNITKEVLSTIKFYLDNVKNVSFSDEGFGYEWNGVPIKVQFITKKYAFFDRPDYKFYMANEYKIPNPFDEYWKTRNFIA